MPLRINTVSQPLESAMSWQEALERLFIRLMDGLAVGEDRISFLRGIIWDDGMFSSRRAPIEASVESLAATAEQLQLTVGRIPEATRARLSEIREARRWEERLVGRLLSANLGTLFDPEGELVERPPLSPLWKHKKNARPLPVTLAHTHGTAFCALSAAAIGIDVEGIKPYQRMKPLVEYHFRRDRALGRKTPFDDLVQWAADEEAFWRAFPILKTRVEASGVKSRSAFERFVTIAATSLWGVEESRLKLRTHRAWETSSRLDSIHSKTQWSLCPETGRWRLLEVWDNSSTPPCPLKFAFALSAMESFDWSTIQMGVPLVCVVGVDDPSAEPGFPESMTISRVEVVEKPAGFD